MRSVNHVPATANTVTASTPSTNSQSNRELNNFADHFRALVSQISRDADDALRPVAHQQQQYYYDEYGYGYGYNNTTSTSLTNSPNPNSPNYPNFPTFNYPDPNQNPTNLPFPPQFPPLFPLPGAQDDHVRILNGFVRRMPTIESLGNRELAVSLVSGSSQDQFTPMSTMSRPQMEFTGTGSDPPSRANSLSMAAAMESFTTTSTEVGEVVEMGELVGVDVVMGGGGEKDRDEGGGDRDGGMGSASRSTLFSYYTAQSSNSYSSSGRTSSPVPLTPSSDTATATTLITRTAPIIHLGLKNTLTRCDHSIAPVELELELARPQASGPNLPNLSNPPPFLLPPIPTLQCTLTSSPAYPIPLPAAADLYTQSTPYIPLPLRHEIPIGPCAIHIPQVMLARRGKAFKSSEDRVDIAERRRVVGRREQGREKRRKWDEVLRSESRGDDISQGG
ncbi:hypothetical protein GYMLUDRAFT_239248 [Collybiopsis luxurians FD-317 M1]|nr:hypothetical protein GYMLUDRAFT_239248 [Collybiopsis luxurians FD-317 M1]